MFMNLGKPLTDQLVRASKESRTPMSVIIRKALELYLPQFATEETIRKYSGNGGPLRAPIPEES